MTATDLVRAVREITQASGRPIASGDPEIYAWCRSNGIDWGDQPGWYGRQFHRADHDNAPKSLRKFKIEPLTHRGRNAWCLAERWLEACEWTAKNDPWWRAIPWDDQRRNWIWKCAERVDGTVAAFLDFDREALARCHAAASDQGGDVEF
jgi:hypothetical protein